MELALSLSHPRETGTLIEAICICRGCGACSLIIPSLQLPTHPHLLPPLLSEISFHLLAVFVFLKPTECTSDLLCDRGFEAICWSLGSLGGQTTEDHDGFPRRTIGTQLFSRSGKGPRNSPHPCSTIDSPCLV